MRRRRNDRGGGRTTRHGSSPVTGTHDDDIARPIAGHRRLDAGRGGHRRGGRFAHWSGGEGHFPEARRGRRARTQAQGAGEPGGDASVSVCSSLADRTTASIGRRSSAPWHRAGGTIAHISHGRSKAGAAPQALRTGTSDSRAAARDPRRDDSGFAGSGTACRSARSAATASTGYAIRASGTAGKAGRPIDSTAAAETT